MSVYSHWKIWEELRFYHYLEEREKRFPGTLDLDCFIKEKSEKSMPQSPSEWREKTIEESFIQKKWRVLEILNMGQVRHQSYKMWE